MSSQIEIHTPRLLLKTITPALVKKLFSNKSKADIIEFFAATEEGYNHLSDMNENGMETHRISFFYFLLIEKDRNRPIGECGYHTWNRTHRRADLFYSLRTDGDKKKGYMTEALGEVLGYGFDKLGLHRVAAMTAIGNEPSLRLLHNFGFTREGTLREDYVVNGKNEDSECYSLLKWEWEERGGVKSKK